MKDYEKEQNTIILGASLNEIKKSVNEKERERTVTVRPSSTARSKVKAEPVEEIPLKTDDMSVRAASSKPRPKSSARGQSRQGMQSRAASSKGSRPASRTNSRIGSSRSSSRMEGYVSCIPKSDFLSLHLFTEPLKPPSHLSENTRKLQDKQMLLTKICLALFVLC